MIRQGPLNQTVPVDSTVVLGCQTAGSPPPTIHWKKDGVVVSPVDSRMSITDTGSLEIRYTKVGECYKKRKIRCIIQGKAKALLSVTVSGLLSWGIQASILV